MSDQYSPESIMAANEIFQPTDSRGNQPRLWRIYFNARSAYPHIWSVDEGTNASEILVRWFSIREVTDILSNTILGPQPGGVEREEQPVAWIEVYATAIFGGGGVTFYGNR